MIDQNIVRSRLLTTLMTLSGNVGVAIGCNEAGAIERAAVSSCQEDAILQTCNHDEESGTMQKRIELTSLEGHFNSVFLQLADGIFFKLGAFQTFQQQAIDMILL